MSLSSCRRPALIVFALAPACVSSVRGRDAIPATTAPVTPDEAALSALQTALLAGDLPTLRAGGLSLTRASGQRELTGEPAEDERVAAVTLIARAGERREAVSLLLRTTCGNAWVLSYRARPHAWEWRARDALVRGEQPGSCARTAARGEAMALSSDAPREFAVAWSTQDDTGERALGPVLRVFRLEDDGTLRELLHDAPFGGTDDVTGALTEGAFAVLDDTPPPRDLFVTVRAHDDSHSGGRTLSGTRREYVLRGASLVLRRTVEERSE